MNNTHRFLGMGVLILFMFGTGIFILKDALKQSEWVDECVITSFEARDTGFRADVMQYCKAKWRRR